MQTYYIYAIHKDDGNYTDPDAAIDYYFYFTEDYDGRHYYYASRDYLVKKVKNGEAEAWTWPNDRLGARCEIKHSLIHDIDYLKTVANSSPEDNLSNLPEKSLPGQ